MKVKDCAYDRADLSFRSLHMIEGRCIRVMGLCKYFKVLWAERRIVRFQQHRKKIP